VLCLVAQATGSTERTLRDLLGCVICADPYVTRDGTLTELSRPQSTFRWRPRGPQVVGTGRGLWGFLPPLGMEGAALHPLTQKNTFQHRPERRVRMFALYCQVHLSTPTMSRENEMLLPIMLSQDKRASSFLQPSQYLRFFFASIN
jgi:hypothetical protein